MRPTLILQPSSIDLPPPLTIDHVVSELRAAAAAWSDLGAQCGAPLLVVGAPAQRRLVNDDNVNLVVFRTQRWCHNEHCSHADTYPRFATAMTSVFPPHASGLAVRGADIELNAWGFQFSGGDVKPVESDTHPNVSLKAVLLHELGHVLGLPDMCSAESGPHRAPSEDGCGADELGSVMFSPALREQLSPADAALLCATSGTSLHPAAEAPGSEHTGTPLTHAVTPIKHEWPAFACLGAIVLLVTVHRRLRALALARLARAQAHLPTDRT